MHQAYGHQTVPIWIPQVTKSKFILKTMQKHHQSQITADQQLAWAEQQIVDTVNGY